MVRIRECCVVTAPDQVGIPSRTLGNKAAKAGIELARALSAKVTAYYAIERLQLIFDEGYMMDQKTIDGLEESARAAGQKRVNAIGKMAKAA